MVMHIPGITGNWYNNPGPGYVNYNIPKADMQIDGYVFTLLSPLFLNAREQVIHILIDTGLLRRGI